MEDIVLNEEDVPGVHFTKNPEEYSVVNLKRWLEYHGVKQNGKIMHLHTVMQPHTHWSSLLRKAQLLLLGSWRPLDGRSTAAQ